MEIVDLLAADGRGPVWGTASADLNCTLVAWPAGEGVIEHVNAERDVLLVVVEGSGTLTIDRVAHAVRAGHATVIPKGAGRGIAAGPDGIRYLTSHTARGGLTIAPRTPAAG